MTVSFVLFPLDVACQERSYVVVSLVQKLAKTKGTSQTGTLRIRAKSLEDRHKGSEREGNYGRGN